MTGLKESIWVMLAHWGIGVTLRRALETHIDGYLQKLEKYLHSSRPPCYKALQQEGYDLAVEQMFKFLKGTEGDTRSNVSLGEVEV